MRWGKTGSSSGIEAAVNSGLSLKVTIAGIAKRSERRAWIVAWPAVALALILVGGCLLFPLKGNVPSLLMGDAYTGASTVSRLRDDFQNRSVTPSAVVSRSSSPTTYRGLRPRTPLSGNAAILRRDHAVEACNGWQFSLDTNKVSS